MGVRTGGRTARRAVVAALVAAVGLVAGVAMAAAPAGAHAVFVSSDPVDGSTLDESPEQIQVLFTEPVELSATTLELLDASGASHPTSAPETAPGDGRTLIVPVDSLPDGAYTLSYRVVSRVDGHPTGGSLRFGVGETVDAVGDEGVELPGLSFLETAGRLTLFGGLIPLIGVATVVPYAFGSLVRRAHRRLAFGSGVVALLGLVLLALAQRSSAGVGFGTFLGTAIGQAIIWRTLGLAAMIIALIAALRTVGAAQRAALGVAGVAAAGTALAHVAAGHAANTSNPAVEIASQWVHVVAIGVWLGGLAALLSGLRGLSRQDRGMAARRFSLLAALALVPVVATGTLRTVSELDRVGSLFDSGWGRGVLAKIIGVVVLVGLGAINRFRHVPAAASSTLGLRRIGRGELMVSVLVLGVAAVVASTAPPAPTATNGANGGAALVSDTGSDVATSVRAELTADPGIPGANELRLQVLDFDSEEPIEGATVRLRLSHPDVEEAEVELEETEPGYYDAESSALSVPGAWQVTALVQQGVDAVEVPLELELDTQDGVAAPAEANGDLNGAEPEDDGLPPDEEEPPAVDLTVEVDPDDPNVAAGEVPETGLMTYQFLQDEFRDGLGDFDFTRGEAVEVWFEPGPGGVTTLSVRFLDPSGGEAGVVDPIETRANPVDPDSDETATQGELLAPPAHRLSGGLAFADFDLPPGAYDFEVVGVGTGDGRPFRASFRVTVE